MQDFIIKVISCIIGIPLGIYIYYLIFKGIIAYFNKRKIKREVTKWYKVPSNLRELDLSRVIVLDVETTGLKPGKDEILQLTIINGLGEVLFNEYIRPSHRKRWPDAANIHGITPKFVADKPTIDEFDEQLEEIFRLAYLVVGYNLEFDMSFILEADIIVPNTLKGNDVMKDFSNFRKVPTKHGYKWFKLKACANYFGHKLSNLQAHNSLNDCMATLACFKSLIEVYNRQEIRRANTMTMDND